MKIEYDPEIDAHYIQRRDGEIDDTLEAAKYIFVDVDEDGVPLGLEILFVGRLLNEVAIGALEEALIENSPVLSQEALKAKADYETDYFITLEDYLAKLDTII